LYGLCIALGLVACVWVFYFYTKKKQMPTEVQNFALIVAIAAIVLGFVFAEYITSPIKRLEREMQKLTKGEFKPVSLPASGNSEIVSLYESFNRMMKDIHELMKENEQRYLEQQNSEMQALQAQINPHFLYNTLDSIIWMIETDDREEAIEMTSALAHFFRKAIGSYNVFVSIDEELEYTRQYLIIQRMRYKNKLNFVINVEEEVLKYSVVKLVLQPLVENSLYHGLKYKEGQGKIQILGYRNGDKIYLKVIDDGIGMDEEVAAKILDSEQDMSTERNSGIGIRNVQRRIQLYYGKEYGIYVRSEKGIGTEVTLVIPARVSAGEISIHAGEERINE